MNQVHRLLLMAVAVLSCAEGAASECSRDEVEAHVREQFAVYGPQSANHEYFGFIYLHEGGIGSAVTRSRPCHADKCLVDSTEALKAIPRPATVLGEWHTHPHGGSAALSKHDVVGAYSNRHISCYLAFYSTPSGEIYAWDPKRISVPVAMATRAPLGNYNDSSRSAGIAVLAANGPTR